MGEGPVNENRGMENPKVSIIVPVYNTEAYVGQTLECLTGQTLREIEIIVIDDGSTDGSRAVVEEAARRDTRIRIYSQPNKGLSEARNAGLARVCGEFVYFMDSDDLLDADAMECCLRKCEAEELDFVIFDAETFGCEGKMPSWFDYKRCGRLEDRLYTGPELLDELLALGLYRGSVCLNFIRTGMLNENGLSFCPGILHEDELFTPMLYLSAGRVASIGRAFFKRRIREGSIMAAPYSQRNLQGYLTVVRRLDTYARTLDAGRRATVRRLIRYILNPAVFNAWRLPLRERLHLSGTILLRYSGVVRARSLIVLLFKRPLVRLIGR